MVTDRARPVNPEFETRIEKIYEADVMPVFFSDVDNTLNSINRAVSNYTQGQITETVKREDLFKVNSMAKIVRQLLMTEFLLIGSIDFDFGALLPRQVDECLQHNIHKARTLL